MSPENLEAARTWFFKASSVTYLHDGPERVSFDTNFFSHILDARRPCQILSISKADTICFSAASKDQNHAIVEGFIHARCKIRRGTAVRCCEVTSKTCINFRRSAVDSSQERSQQDSHSAVAAVVAVAAVAAVAPVLRMRLLQERPAATGMGMGPRNRTKQMDMSVL